jgi:Domain of unknown function (DUF4032)/Lipopolysaccharide kinase (Kdo/WaaP) family
VGLRITAAPADPALLDLPWSTPLADWPDDRLVALPRGISRHVVRFVRIDGAVYAVKEAVERMVEREYRLLRALDRAGEPVVEPVGVVTGRQTADGEPLEPVLVTRHLEFSLPYRFLFSGSLRPETSTRLLDALAVLLVRLHLIGFFWGDCSFSNVLFRRDAGAFAAYLVDAETAELHPSGLTDGQRHHDLEIAQGNVAGELFDVAAAGLLHESVDPEATSEDVVRRYQGLWHELYAPERIKPSDRHLMEARIRRLQRLGFDVEEVQLAKGADESWIDFQPKVVEPGHHSRRLLQLTGLDVQENQARRFLADMEAFRVGTGLVDESEEIVAHRWLLESFEPTVRMVPEGMRGKLEPAEIFHEILEHAWYLSEAAGHEVGLDVVTESYIENILAFRPDEASVLGADLSPIVEE